MSASTTSMPPSARVKQLGGVVHVPPTDIPNISRFSVIGDPQMATLVLAKWLRPRREQSAEFSAPGHIRWHELFAADWEKAFAFYGTLFGWQNAGTDVDAAGAYRLFSTHGQTIGGMFTKPPTQSAPFWLYYFNVDDIDAAAKHVKAGGGDILNGPMEVLEGNWIVECRDPQSAMFALVGQRARAPIGYFERTHRPIHPSRGTGGGLGRAAPQSEAGGLMPRPIANCPTGPST